MDRVRLAVEPADWPVAILGVGGYRPRRVVGNAELCELIDSTPAWIEERSGIVERRFAAADETLPLMASAAAGEALERSGLGPDDVDLVVVASMSDLVQTPPLAIRVAHEIGASRAAGFDIGAACAGFCHAVAVASDTVRAGNARTVLVVGAERMTDIVEPADRSISFLFSDGAGALVLGRSAHRGIGPVIRGADGAHAAALQMTAPWAADGERPWMRMDGKRVFRWAVEQVGPAAERALVAAGVPKDRLDAFVPHQANQRIVDLMAHRLGLCPGTAVARDGIRTGNASAASIPLALEALVSDGRLGSGDTALLVGFGAGLNFAALTVQLA